MIKRIMLIYNDDEGKKNDFVFWVQIVRVEDSVGGGTARRKGIGVRRITLAAHCEEWLP